MEYTPYTHDQSTGSFEVRLPYREVPVVPAYLSPFPPLKRLLRLTREEQERLLERRATELLLRIEGYRAGFYIEMSSYKKAWISNARRRFHRLRNVAMQLGFWTDGRWDLGEEETHWV
ncbi:hypothetical protein DZK27_09235 [Rhodobacteraceae bacterium 63075]|nr:hypothetical protein DZK27_09235 [Rhodobacteraceae bacterium 63075]